MQRIYPSLPEDATPVPSLEAADTESTEMKAEIASLEVELNAPPGVPSMSSSAASLSQQQQQQPRLPRFPNAQPELPSEGFEEVLPVIAAHHDSRQPAPRATAPASRFRQAGARDASHIDLGPLPEVQTLRAVCPAPLCESFWRRCCLTSP